LLNAWVTCSVKSGDTTVPSVADPYWPATSTSSVPGGMLAVWL
jgi:hypothetical protein